MMPLDTHELADLQASACGFSVLRPCSKQDLIQDVQDQGWDLEYALYYLDNMPDEDLYIVNTARINGQYWFVREI